jgi:predicted nucleic acid-binding protein
MRQKVVCLDTSVLIEYYRKKEKPKTLLHSLNVNYQFAASTVTEYEIYAGSTEVQELFWYNLFQNILLLKFDSAVAVISGFIYKQLKAENKLIENPDIFIAATAMKYNLPLATLNKKHFERIEGLKLITIS